MTTPKEPTRLQDRIDWDELAELTARDIAEAEAEIKRQCDSAHAASCCVCGEPESEGYCGCEEAQ